MVASEEEKLIFMVEQLFLLLGRTYNADAQCPLEGSEEPKGIFPGDLPNRGIERRSTALQADSLSSEPPRKSNSVWQQETNVYLKREK